jgi:hypothetical protein
MILTIFCPQALTAEGRTLSGIFGLGSTDYTGAFPSFNWKRDGAAYGAHSATVSDGLGMAVQSAAIGALDLSQHLPAWPVGMVAAAQTALDNATIVLSLDPESPPTVPAGRMIVALGVEPLTLARVCGLTRD